LILFYPPQQDDANKKIQDISEAYKTDFSRESVLEAEGLSSFSAETFSSSMNFQQNGWSVVGPRVVTLTGLEKSLDGHS
jgi:hypothetical protein